MSQTCGVAARPLAVPVMMFAVTLSGTKWNHDLFWKVP
jgi:hypothetical protein